MGNRDFNPNGYKSFKEAMEAYANYKAHGSKGNQERFNEKRADKGSMAPPTPQRLKAHLKSFHGGKHHV